MKYKYLKTNGFRDYLSPLIFGGELIVCGVDFGSSYNLASEIISAVSAQGISKEEFTILAIKSIPKKFKKRFITFEVVKKFLLSRKAKSPLFIFLGGMAGKTLMGNFISQHLGVTQAIAIDNEKFRIYDPDNSQAHLWKAVYESPDGYTMTVDALVPWMIKMIDRNLFDHSRYRKWCYFWEGIYLSPLAIKKIYHKFGQTNYFFSVFILPKFKEIKARYILRWQKETGVEELEKRKNYIDLYLKNIKAIRSHISENIDPVASFVIQNIRLEKRLENFYILLHQTLEDIAEKEIPGWVNDIELKPEKFQEFIRFLKS